MKVMIVSPPKSGANRLRCLLATLYGLRAVDARDAPIGGALADVSRWLETLPDDCVTHTDLPFDPALLASAADHGVTFIAIVRHPFDLFVSNREVRSRRDLRANRRMHNRDPLDTTLPTPQSSDSEYPLGSFAADLQSQLDWAAGAAATIRYEDILEQPDVALTLLAGVFGHLDEAKISRAVELCPAEQRIVSSGNRGVRMTELPPGSWQTRIDAATLEQLQSQFRQAVARLGYEPSAAS
jgi:Sulfotransferase domain